MKHDEMLGLMGKPVVVTKRLVRASENTDGRFDRLSRKWVTEVLLVERVGWVVGFRWFQNGKIEPGRHGFMGIDGYEPPEPTEFKETGPRTAAMMVTFWPTMKPICVPMDGWRMADGLFEVPSSPSYRFTDRDREALSEEMADWPRDEKGRFLKGHHIEFEKHER